MRISIPVLALCCVVLLMGQRAASSPAAGAFTFRGVPWGASREEVRRTLPAVTELAGGLSLQDTLEGRFSFSSFIFDAGALVGVTTGLGFLNPQSSGTSAIEDYEQVAGLLAKKYGKPTRTEENWDPPKMRGRVSKGRALSESILTLRTTWFLKDTIVQLVLLVPKDGGATVYSIHYRDLRYEQQRRDRQNAETQKKL